MKENYKTILGLNIFAILMDEIKLQQQKTINNCLNLLGLSSEAQNVRLHNTPAETSKILHANPSGPKCKQSWNYCAVVGCLNYIQAMT